MASGRRTTGRRGSWGGRLTRLAARHPTRIRSLILLETTADPEPAENVPRYRRLNLVARWLGLGLVAGPVMKIMFSRSFLGDPGRAGERERWRHELLGNRRSIVRAANGVIERSGVADELDGIRCPTLVIVGEEDVATVPAKAVRIVERVRGAVLVRIPEAGHSSSIEQPGRVIAAMEEHFVRVPMTVGG